INKIAATGYLSLNSVSLPAYQLYDLTGRVMPKQVQSGNSGLGPLRAQAALALNSVRLRDLEITDITGDITIKRSSGLSGPVSIALDNLQASTAGGTILA